MRALCKQVRVAFALAAGLTLAGCPCVPAQTHQAAPEISVISGALRSGDIEQALQLAKDALSKRPDDCQLLSLEALAYMAQHQPDPALDAFGHALRTCPGYLPALEGAAQLQLARKSPEAIPLLTRITEMQPANVAAQGMLASALESSGRCTEALPRFVASRPMFSSTPALAQGYASCLAQTGDLAAAMQQYSALAQEHPSDTYVYDVALLQWRLKQSKDALATIEPLLTARQFGLAFALGSRVAESLGDTPRAVELLRTAILLAPDREDNYLEFANLAFAHTSFQVGVDMLNAGLRRLPAAASLYLARGVLEMQISQQDQAVADFRQAHRLDPKLSLSEDALGMVQTQQHQSQKSLASFREETRQHPDDPLLQYLLAEQLAEGGEASGASLETAVGAARRATELDPGYQPAHDLLAKLYLRAQQPRLAMEQAELALKLNPDDQEALYQELMARRRAGETKDLNALVARLNRVREENARKQQSVDRYRLVEDTTASQEGQH